jgi:hypothetical protein
MKRLTFISILTALAMFLAAPVVFGQYGGGGRGGGASAAQVAGWGFLSADTITGYQQDGDTTTFDLTKTQADATYLALADTNYTDSTAIASWGFAAHQFTELFIPEDSTYTIELTQWGWQKVTKFSAHNETSGMVFAGDSLTILIAGVYKFALSFSLEGGVNATYKGAFAIDGVIDSTHTWLRSTSAASSAGSASLHAAHNVNAGQGVSVWVVNIENDADIDVHSVGLLIERVGDIQE